MPFILNGNLAEIDAEPKLESGTLYVPLRKVAAALAQKIDFEPSTKTAIVYAASGEIITLKEGQENIEIDGRFQLLQSAPFVENGEMWVPVRFFESVLGYTLQADSQAGIVELRQ